MVVYEKGVFHIVNVRAVFSVQTMIENFFSADASHTIILLKTFTIGLWLLLTDRSELFKFPKGFNIVMNLSTHSTLAGYALQREITIWIRNSVVFIYIF